MFLLRLQAVINGQPQLYKQVAVYNTDGITPAVLYSPTTEAAISNIFTTDASGFIRFKIPSLMTLTFRTITGLTLSAAAYSMYTNSGSPTGTAIAPLESDLQLACSETIIAGQVVTIEPITNRFKLASATDPLHLTKLVGIALQSGNVNDVIRVVTENFFYSSTFNFTYPAPVYLGTNGSLTQNPVGLVFRQQVGVAVSPTKFNIQIGLAIKRS